MSSGRALVAHGNSLTVTKLTSSGLVRKFTLNTKQRGSSTISGTQTRNSRTVLRGTAGIPDLQALIKFSRTEPVTWGLIRPWSIRTTTRRITIMVGGWGARTYWETPRRRTACRRVSYHNSIALGLCPVVWAEVARVIAIVAMTRVPGILNHSGQITPLWDSLIRRTLG